jgi:hypothetical protein
MADPTCRDIITEALEELRARGMGDDPSPEEIARGLTRLQSMWRAGVEQSLFGRVEDYLATGDYTAEEGQRVYAAGFTITLPTSITDEDTGELRRPLDFSMIQVVDAGEDPQISLYDAHRAAWVRIDNLTLSSECPFGSRYRHGLAAALAQVMGPLFARTADNTTQAYAGALNSALSMRLSAPRTAVEYDYF